MADNLDYTDIVPDQANPRLLRFPLNRAPTAKETEFLTGRKLTVANGFIESPADDPTEPELVNAVQTAIGRVDVALDLLADQAEDDVEGRNDETGKIRELVEARKAEKAREKGVRGRRRGEARERNDAG